MKRLLFLLVLIPSLAKASSLSFELGKTKTNYNRFSIPSNIASKLEMPQGESIRSFRLTGFIDQTNGNQLYFLLAPLEVGYNLSSANSFRFNNTDFNANQATNVNYKFNSYRIGYLWTWRSTHLNYWIGVVGKLRDAKIEVTQNDVRDSYNNVGFVPLASFGFELFLGRDFSLFSHTDALSAKQGAAFDSNLELRYRLGGFATSIGRRILGGGADNDKVYTFSQFDTTYLGLTFLY
jgi:hypothetical protein